MFEIADYLAGKDKNFRIVRNNITGIDRLCVINQIGNARPVITLRHLRYEKTQLGVAAQYHDESGTVCSYLSLWDGRDGVFLPAETTDTCYYIPWMECFALQLNIGKNGRRYIAGDYFFVFTDKRRHWLTGAIEAFNTEAPDGARIRFGTEYGAFLSLGEEPQPIDEICIKRGSVFVTSGDIVKEAPIGEVDAKYGAMPIRAKVKFSQREIVDNAPDGEPES